MVVYGLKLLYSGKSGCIQAKAVLFWQSGCILTKVVDFGQELFIRVKMLYSGKVVVFGQI